MTITKPIIPGTVIRFIGETIPRIPPTAASVVAVPLTHDWGPVGEATLVSSFSEFSQIFGDSDTPGRTAVAGAFAGQGIQGVGGAGGVLVYRMAAGTAAKAAHNYANSTPATALTLTAKYEGTRGNRISAVVADDPNDVTKDRIRIRLDGVVTETYTYLATDIAALAAAINSRSHLVTATAPVTGVALAPVTASLTAGADGATLTSGEWLDALDGIEFGQFSILAPFNLTDDTIMASVLSWVQAQEQANRPVVLVVGGAAGEDISAALARSTAMADPHVVNFGVGTWHDDLLNKDLSTAQLAPRIAGILASLGDTRSLTYARIGGLTNVGATGAPVDAVESAINGGVTVLMRTTSTDSDLRVAKGVTTFTNATDLTHPLDVFSDPRLVRVMDNYVRAMKVWGDDNIIGNTPVNDDARAAVYGEARRLQADLVSRGLILTKADGATIDPFAIVDPPGDPNLLDAIPYQFGWQFARTANFILGEGKVR